MRFLSEKIALITGASGGLGRSLCQQLLEAGCHVVAFDRDADALDKLSEDCAHYTVQLVPICGDITNPPDLIGLKDLIADKYGRLDLLFHNAGVTHFSLFEAAGSTVIERVMQINFIGAVRLTEIMLPLMHNSASATIIPINSVAAYAPLYARSGYAASKHAAHAFFETLRGEIAPKNIRVTQIYPAYINSQTEHPAPNMRQAKDGTSRPGAAKNTTGKLMTPNWVAQKILHAVERRKRRLILGRVAWLAYYASCLFPAFYERKMLETTVSEID